MQRDLTHADVTVAIASCNRPAALLRCVTAILDGTVRPSELVIVDQSVTTDTRDLVVAHHWDELAGFKYIHQAQRGLAASRNAAIAAATRPVIAFTDDDCVPDREWVAALVANFHSTDAPDAVTGAVLPLGPEQPGRYAVSTRASSTRAVFRGRALPWAVGSGANTAVRKERLVRIGGFDERLGVGAPGQAAEDLDLLYRLLRDGATVVYAPAAVVFHERADATRRLATRSTYGFGLGALGTLWARRRDPFALWMVGRWCFDRSRALLGACLHRRWRRVHEELLMLRGLACGVAYGLRERSAQ